MAVLIDTYNESNWTNDLVPIAGAGEAKSQSFELVGDNHNLTSVNFYCSRFGSPSGNVYAKLYSHSGTYGTSSVPDTLLATSDAVDVSTISTSRELVEFTFSGDQRYEMSAGYYVIVFDGSQYTGDGSNWASVGVDVTGTHAGNHANTNDSITWTPDADFDLCFYVYGQPLPSGGINALLNYYY